jgi:osmotically-inducible protein OsmY
MFLRTIQLGALGLVLGAAAVSLPARGQDQTQPDNTKVNKREASQPTADQQKMNSSDREMTRKIRRAIVADKSLSTYGHNVKVITQNGTVTLKGPVHSEDEKRTIESKATEIAGQNNVKNEITVKGDSQADRAKH